MAAPTESSRRLTSAEAAARAASGVSRTITWLRSPKRRVRPWRAALDFMSATVPATPATVSGQVRNTSHPSAAVSLAASENPPK